MIVGLSDLSKVNINCIVLENINIFYIFIKSLPINRTAFSCFAINSIKYNILVLSILGTKIV
jgi:hypothetical protein